MILNNNELRHHGILGQKWGIRRFQKNDGTLTSAGKKRYADNESSTSRKLAEMKGRKTIIRGAAIGGAVAVLTAGVTSVAVSQYILKHSTSSVSAIKTGSTQKGLSYVNKMMSQRQSAMNNANKAFDALNSAARKFR